MAPAQCPTICRDACKYTNTQAYSVATALCVYPHVQQCSRLDVEPVVCNTLLIVEGDELAASLASLSGCERCGGPGAEAGWLNTLLVQHIVGLCSRADKGQCAALKLENGGSTPDHHIYWPPTAQQQLNHNSTTTAKLT